MSDYFIVLVNIYYTILGIFSPDKLWSNTLKHFFIIYALQGKARQRKYHSTYYVTTIVIFVVDVFLSIKSNELTNTHESTWWEHVNLLLPHSMLLSLTKRKGVLARGLFYPEGVSLTATDRSTGWRTILLWTNSPGRWSIAQSDGPSLLVKQPPGSSMVIISSEYQGLCPHS